MKFALLADMGAQKVSAVTASTSGVAAWWTTAKEIALELFGVPMQVVLACATAAFGALSFQSETTYLKTMRAGVVWTGVGTYGAQLGLSVIGSYLGVEVPTGALAGAGMVVAGGGALFVTKDNVTKARAAVGRWIEGLWSAGRKDEK